MITNQWYAILPSRAVRKHQVLGLRRCGLDLVLFRRDDNTLACLTDRCTHRGAALSLGKLRGNCLQCPFHGLEFQEDGTCRHIPALGQISSADLSRYNVESFPVREAHDIIYLWFGDQPPESEALPFFPDELETLSTYSELADPWDAHYSRAIENQLDVVHLPFVHHNTIGRGNKTLVNGPRVIIEPEGLKTSADNEVDHGQAPKPSSEARIKDTYLRFRFPNVWLNHISPKIKVFIYFAPVDDTHSILYIRFYNRITGLKPIDKLIAWFGKHANKVIERQDRRVVVTQRPHVTSLRMGERLIPGDAPIIEYRKRRSELQNR